MTTLTQCQQQVLDMLISYQKERGFPPTNQEVATMLGYRSVNAAVEHLRALEKKGVITIKRGVARGITLHTAVKDDDSEAVVTNGAIVIHTQRLKSDPGGNLLS